MRLSALGVVVVAAGFCVAAPGEHKTPTIPELIRQLSSNDYQAHPQAARRLGNLGVAARDAVPALAKTLHDPFVEARLAAAKALGQIGKPAVPGVNRGIAGPRCGGTCPCSTGAGSHRIGRCRGRPRPGQDAQGQ